MLFIWTELAALLLLSAISTVSLCAGGLVPWSKVLWLLCAIYTVLIGVDVAGRFSHE